MSICVPTFVISDVDLGIIMLCYLSLVLQNPILQHGWKTGAIIPELEVSL